MISKSTRTWAGLLSAAVLLGGCSGNEAPAGGTTGGEQSGSNETVELRMMWWGSQARHEATLEVIELFESKHDHIQINAEYLGGDGYWDKLNTLVAGGNQPDLLQLGNNYPDYVTKDTLLDLTPYMGEIISSDDIDESIVDSGKLDGKQYGINLGSNALGIIYNATMLESAGIEPPPQDWTWEGFEDYMRELKAALPDVIPMSDQAGDQHFFNHYVRQQDRAIYKDGEIGFTKDDLVAWLTRWEDYRQEGLIPKADTASAHTEVGPENSLIVKGQAVMKLAFSNQLNTYQESMQDELGITLLPSGGDGTVSGIWLQPSQFMSVSSKTAHPEEAAMFLDFMINDPEATVILGSERGIPGSASVRDALRAEATETQIKIFDFIDLAIAGSREMDREIPNGSDYASSLVNAVQKVAFGAESIDRAADEVIAAAERALQR